MNDSLERSNILARYSEGVIKRPKQEFSHAMVWAFRNPKQTTVTLKHLERRETVVINVLLGRTLETTVLSVALSDPNGVHLIRAKLKELIPEPKLNGLA